MKISQNVKKYIGISQNAKLKVRELEIGVMIKKYLEDNGISQAFISREKTIHDIETRFIAEDAQITKDLGYEVDYRELVAADYYAKGGKPPSYKVGWNDCRKAIGGRNEQNNS